MPTRKRMTTATRALAIVGGVSTALGVGDASPAGAALLAHDSYLLVQGAAPP